MKKNTQKIVLSGLLIAISIILSRSPMLSPYAGGRTLKIDTSYGVIAFAGLLMGPFYGFSVGFLADLLGANLFPVGAYFIGFSISSAMIGFIPGLARLLIRKKRINVLINIIAISFACFINNLLGTFFVRIYYKPVTEIYLLRLFWLVLLIPVTVIVAITLQNIYNSYYNNHGPLE